MKRNPLDFYNLQLKECESQIQQLKKHSLFLSVSRLIVFGLVSIFIYLNFGNGSNVLLVALLGLPIFLILLSRYVSVKSKQRYWKKKHDLIKHEVNFLSTGECEFDDGLEFVDQTHFFSSDIDLFGPNSLFQYINRTQIKESKSLLASVLSSNDIHNIEAKQTAIEELSSRPEWRFEYLSKCALVVQNFSHKVVFNWLNEYRPILSKITRFLSRVFPFISALVLGLYLFGVTGYYPLVTVFFIGLLITSFFIKKINKTSIHLSELKSVFAHYGDLIAQIEQAQFDSKHATNVQSQLKTNGTLASHHVKQFSKYLSALDQRHNILFAVLGNGFLLWDCAQMGKIDQWISSHSPSVKSWFEAIVWFEEQCSLANFHFNHPEFVFPKLDAAQDKVIEASALGHFFIAKDKRVCNDFSLKDNHFSIVTGANMAGKSTFLRTVAFSIVSANVGLPVCAESYNYKPIKLVTSMRNTDSLKDDSSYFFAELARLKVIVDAVDLAPYFVILDEILKGTNSKDKEEGSIKLMKKMSKTKASGLIATHDLGLCEIEKEISNIRNQYFDAEIRDDELYFDYSLKEGICQNMNASFLLKKMEIV